MYPLLILYHSFIEGCPKYTTSNIVLMTVGLLLWIVVLPLWTVVSLWWMREVNYWIIRTPQPLTRSAQVQGQL